MFLESFNNSLRHALWAIGFYFKRNRSKMSNPKSRCLKTKQKEILAFVSSIERQNMQPNQQEIPKAGLYHNIYFTFMLYF